LIFLLVLLLRLIWLFALSGHFLKMKCLLSW